MALLKRREFFMWKKQINLGKMTYPMHPGRVRRLFFKHSHLQWRQTFWSEPFWHRYRRHLSLKRKQKIRTPQSKPQQAVSDPSRLWYQRSQFLPNCAGRVLNEIMSQHESEMTLWMCTNWHPKKATYQFIEEFKSVECYITNEALQCRAIL